METSRGLVGLYQSWEVLTDAPLSALRLRGQHRSVRSYQGWYYTMAAVVAAVVLGIPLLAFLFR
jgi:hypothetical protein